MQQRRKVGIAALCIAVVLVLSTPGVFVRAAENISPSSENRPVRFPGMDQSVNVDLANKAGIPARKPYIDVEEWGDLWNLMLLLGGGVCGFVVGLYWDQIWGRSRKLDMRAGSLDHKVRR